MNTFRKIASVIIIVLFGLLTSTGVYAQQPGCPSDCPGNPDCPPQCVPIDGGLSLLIAAGVGLGARRAYKRRKQTDTNPAV